MIIPKVWNMRDENKPNDAVYIGRPSKWGNPYSHLPSKRAIEVKTREDAITAYEIWIEEDTQKWLRNAARKELKGKHLICWCKPKPCHGDILLEIANSDGE